MKAASFNRMLLLDIQIRIAVTYKQYYKTAAYFDESRNSNIEIRDNS